MKTITCRAMGGMCDEAVSGSTPEELIGAGMEHLKAAHPEMAADINKAGPNDPMVQAWSEKFNADFETLPESE